METLDYYEKNAQRFVKDTAFVDFKETQERFLRKLAPGSSILDFGCGSGRDTKYFLKRGFQVTATDGSAEMVEAASAYTGLPVRKQLFQELCEVGVYDGIWACASILHLPKAELRLVLNKMQMALKEKGIIYASFKYGCKEEIRNGRFFTDFTEESFAEFMEGFAELQILEMWVTTDVRPGRRQEKWLNVIIGTLL